MTPDGIRVLAAVMFTDMEGYTSLMRNDEAKAKKLRDRQRNVLDAKVLMHQGKIIQYYGDGTLSIFGSAIEAVSCAIEVQQELDKEPKVPLRIGIHLADIVYDDEGAYGDGVNVASRIESLASAKSILISSKVNDEIKSHPEFNSVSLGQFELKNVELPVEIFAIAEKQLVIPQKDLIRMKAGGSFKSIAVLPFVNMSNDPENEYFSDGITEEILNALTKVEGLRVTSRTSSFAFKGTNTDMREIGTKLGVTTVLEGSVRKAGNRVRITAQLINALDGYHLWSEVFDRKLEDIFEVQDEISNRIATKLREKLTYSDSNKRLVKSYTNNVDAYKLFLQGLFEWNKWNPHSVKEAVKLFDQAIKAAPEFVLPYVMISSAYVYLGAIGYLKSTRAYPLGKKYALKAIEMDDKIADSHISLGIVRLFYDWDFEGAEESFQTALSISPSNASAHNTYTYLLTAQMRFEEGFEHIKIALDLDPLSIRINHAYGELLLVSGYYKEALEQFDKCLEIDSEFRGSLYSKGWTYCKMDKFEKAIELFEEAHRRTGSDLKGITQLGYAYGKVGRSEEALDLIKKIEKRQELNPDMDLDMDLAVIHIGLGHLDESFRYLNKAYESRNGGILFLLSPLWSEIHSDPRYKELIDKVGVLNYKQN